MKVVYHKLIFVRYGTTEDNRIHRITTKPIYEFNITANSIRDGLIVLASFVNGKWDCNYESKKFSSGSSPYLADDVIIIVEMRHEQQC